LQTREIQGKSLQYLLVEPDGYNPDKQYPVMILMHGFGAHMGDLAGLCPAISRTGYVYVCPNAPMAIQLDVGMSGYAWTPPGDAQTKEDLEKASEAVEVLVNEITDNLNVSPREMILGGFSQGGMMTYSVGLANPELFCGLVVLSGMISENEVLTDILPSGTSPELFIAHGEKDSIVSIDRARNAKTFLEKEGYSPQYHEYDMAHEITQELIDDLVPWVKSVLPPAD